MKIIAKCSKKGHFALSIVCLADAKWLFVAVSAPLVYFSARLKDFRSRLVLVRAL